MKNKLKVAVVLLGLVFVPNKMEAQQRQSSPDLLGAVITEGAKMAGDILKVLEPSQANAAINQILSGGGQFINALLGAGVNNNQANNIVTDLIAQTAQVAGALFESGANLEQTNGVIGAILKEGMNMITGLSQGQKVDTRQQAKGIEGMIQNLGLGKDVQGLATDVFSTISDELQIVLRGGVDEMMNQTLGENTAPIVVKLDSDAMYNSIMRVSYTDQNGRIQELETQTVKGGQTERLTLPAKARNIEVIVKGQMGLGFLRGWEEILDYRVPNRKNRVEVKLTGTTLNPQATPTSSVVR